MFISPEHRVFYSRVKIIHIVCAGLRRDKYWEKRTVVPTMFKHDDLRAIICG
jgi:hypothetical protein